MITLRSVLLLAVLTVAGCSSGGLDFGDNPGHAVPKEMGPLINLPDHLKDGSHE